MTRWAKDVTVDTVHAEYPRPQMVRTGWFNLNGLWQYAIRPKDATEFDSHDGDILVPFPVESALSGVMKRIGPDQRLWYRRGFQLPVPWSGTRRLLHFGAVDWHAQVWINGKFVGEHRGGYSPFTLDITDALNASGDQQIVVSVWDPSDAGPQPRGKQVREPHGIWYTPTTGIWQTVWIEPVNDTSIASLDITPHAADGTVRVSARVRGAAGGEKLRVAILGDGANVIESTESIDAGVTLKIPQPRLWSPDDPFLYDLRVELLTPAGATHDVVRSYCGLRSIELGKDQQGRVRMLLNGEAVFQFGPLDQGFWPDGLYTAPTDEALRYDIEKTKQLGFNMIRKHVKVEPDRWYYWCDKLGMLVWQDMPSGDRNARWTPLGNFDGTEMERSSESAQIYERELREMTAALRNHPSIVAWVPFNEGWGQFDTVRITKLVQQLDPTRLVNCASGGNDFPVGDIHDVHRYPGPTAPLPNGKRAPVLGEYGGLGLPLSGHTWQDKKNWGYKSFKTQAEVTKAYLELIDKLLPLIDEPGLAAAIYTQTTDVEIEVNGLLTYDREVNKLPADEISAANRRVTASLSPATSAKDE